MKVQKNIECLYTYQKKTLLIHTNTGIHSANGMKNTAVAHRENRRPRAVSASNAYNVLSI